MYKSTLEGEIREVSSGVIMEDLICYINNIRLFCRQWDATVKF